MRPPHNGTPTSRAAAEQIEPVSGKARATVLEYVRSRGTEGATADEIEPEDGCLSAIYGTDDQQISPSRLPE